MKLPKISKIGIKIVSVVIIAFFVSVLAAVNSKVFAWNNIDGGDHGGADWIITGNTEVGGVHTNVGQFTINAGVTATIRTFNGTTYGVFQVDAANATILGNIIGDAVGYLATEGVGGGAVNGGGSGGSHGGYGGTSGGGSSGGVLHDAFLAPVAMGGGGGYWNCGTTRGGGAIKINSPGTVTVAGTISMNGATGPCSTGGAAGGSVYIIAGTFAGNGIIRANGGNISDGNQGSGGGGRVAVKYSSANTYSGTLAALGGTNGKVGENGTVVVLDVVNNDLYVRQTQYWRSNPTNEGSVFTYRNITLTNNSTLYLRGYNTTDTDYVGFTFNVTNLNITTGSSINGSGGGYRPSMGPGKGQSCSGGSGGAHGGYGAGNGCNQRSAPYDHFFEPTEAGSGGMNWNCGGAAGGAAIKINATGTVTVNGAISANGNTAYCSDGAGAGGSIYIDTPNLAGGSNITATGGPQVQDGNQGSGSGGRIALKYSTSNTYTGTLDVIGGHSAKWGDDGSAFIYNKTTNDIWFKNSTNIFANPAIDGPNWTFRDVYVQNNATLYLRGYWTNDTDGIGIFFTARNFNLATGTSLNANGMGYGSGRGPGRGINNNGGTGGSYGGVGGSSNGSAARPVYGSITDPVDLGSGGGNWSCGTGAGGGAVRIYATGTLTVGGTITVNGNFGNCADGGGSGGSIYLSAGTVTGAGALSAVGGAIDNGAAGSGAGGRISIKYAVANNYTGTINYAGGRAGHWGADGTYQTNGISDIPTNLTQLKTDAVTVIPDGGVTDETAVTIGVTMRHGQTQSLRAQVEVKQIGVNFTNTPTATGTAVMFSGTPVVGYVTAPGLLDSTNYHWQSRVCDASDNCSPWIVYGASPYDFRVFTNRTPNPPTALGPVELVSGGSVNDSTPTFEFSISDPDADQDIFYTLQIATDNNYTNLVIEYISASGSQGAKTFTIGQPLDGGVYTVGTIGQTLVNGGYFWQIKVTDPKGAESTWVEGRSTDPAFFVDTSNPTVNATNVTFSNAHDGNWTHLEPIITWTAGQDPGGDILGYCVAISETSINGAVPADNPASTAGVLQGLDDGVDSSVCPFIVTGTSFDVSTVPTLTLTNNKQFYVSVLIVDAAGNFYEGLPEESQSLISFKSKQLSQSMSPLYRQVVVRSRVLMICISPGPLLVQLRQVMLIPAFLASNTH